MDGWIKLYRQLSDSQIWLSEPFTRGQAWVDLIMLANHKDGFVRARGVRVDVKRGQVAWSEISLAKRWKWSRGKVRRFLQELEENDSQIVQQKDNVTSLLSIVNYDKFQLNGTADDTPSGTADGQQTDSKRYTNKNDKNDKNDKKNTISVSSRRYKSDGFDQHNRHEVASLKKNLITNFVEKGIPLDKAEADAEAIIMKDQEDYRKFMEFIDNKAPRVNKLEKAFSFAEFIEIRSKYDSKRVAEILLKMDNWKPLLSKNVHAYKTLLNWMRKNET